MWLFQPDPETRADPITWWMMSEGCVDQMLRVLGFKVVSLTRAQHDCPIRNHAERVLDLCGEASHRVARLAREPGGHRLRSERLTIPLDGSL